MIIGIGGMSRAGKTSLSDYLKGIFEAGGKKTVVIAQDDYVFPENQIPKIREKTDWERPESIDFDSFKNAVLRARTHTDIVIAEGLLAFYNHEFNKIYDKRIFVEIPKLVFFERKKRDNRWGDEPHWYIEHIWKSYLKYGRTILKSGMEYLTLDGTRAYKYEKVVCYLES